NVDQAPAGAVQQRHDIERGRAPPAKLREHVVECQAGVDDVLHQQHVAAFDRVVEVARDSYALMRLRARETPEVEVVDHERNLYLPREVGEEEGHALEYTDED